MKPSKTLRPTRLLVSLCCAAAFVLAPLSPVFAQQGPQAAGQQESAKAGDAEDEAADRDAANEPSAQDRAKARAYYKSGVDAFFNQEYALAITYFKRAYSLDPNAIVLYNIALAQAKLGNVEDAFEAAAQADEMGGLPPDTTVKNRARMAAFTVAIGGKRVTEIINPPPKIDKDKKRREQSFVERIDTVGWTGVGIAATGVVVMGVAGFMAVSLQSDIDEYERLKAQSDFVEANQLQADIADQQETGQIILYSGAGLVGVGAAVFLYEALGFTEDEGPAYYATSDGESTSVQMRLKF